MTTLILEFLSNLISLCSNLITLLAARWLLEISTPAADMADVLSSIELYIKSIQHALRWYNSLEIYHQYRASLILKRLYND